MLEGGYDLEALTLCTAAALGALERRAVSPETPTSGGPGASTSMPAAVGITSARRRVGPASTGRLADRTPSLDRP